MQETNGLVYQKTSFLGFKVFRLALLEVKTPCVPKMTIAESQPILPSINAKQTRFSSKFRNIWNSIYECCGGSMKA